MLEELFGGIIAELDQPNNLTKIDVWTHKIEGNSLAGSKAADESGLAAEFEGICRMACAMIWCNC